MDALLALRSAARNGEPIQYVSSTGAPASSLGSATHISLGHGTVLPKTEPTRWKRTPTEFFSLEALALCWQTRTDNAAVYMRQATTEKVVGYVTLTDRKAVIEWLEGKGPEVNDKILPLGMLRFLNVGEVKLTCEDRIIESTTPKMEPPALPSTTSPSKTPAKAAQKRGYAPDPADLDAVKRIRAQEIELRDRNSVLRGVKANVRLRRVTDLDLG